MIYGDNNGLYFNMTQLSLSLNSTSINLNLFRNYSYTISFCVTLVSIKQALIMSQNLTAFKAGSTMTINSDKANFNLDTITKNQFGFDPKYGPVF